MVAITATVIFMGCTPRIPCYFPIAQLRILFNPAHKARLAPPQVVADNYPPLAHSNKWEARQRNPRPLRKPCATQPRPLVLPLPSPTRQKKQRISAVDLRSEER